MIGAYQRIVVKFGSSSVFDETANEIDTERLKNIAYAITDLLEEGKEVVVFSSGAVALGNLILETMLDDLDPLAKKQITGGVGQSALSTAWQHAFAEAGCIGLPVILTTTQLENETVIDSLQTMLTNKMVPVINENIPLQHEHDNDQLAARTAVKLHADLLVIFSDTDGLFTGDPHVDSSAKHVPFVTDIDDTIGSMAGNSISGLGTGGMITKLRAAAIAFREGIPTIIANGQTEYPFQALEEEGRYTMIVPE